jgi:hypothetical protein
LNETTKTNENYTQWKLLTESITDGVLYSLSQAMEEVYGFRNKIVRATPVYTGFMYFGYTPYDGTDFCSISCKMYLRTTAYAKALSTNMYSTLSEGPTHIVNKHRKYILSPEANMGIEDDDGDEVEVDEVDLEKGFRFGKSVVKVASDELDYSKFHMQRELTILYFVPLHTVSCLYTLLLLSILLKSVPSSLVIIILQKHMWLLLAMSKQKRRVVLSAPLLMPCLISKSALLHAGCKR